MGADASGKIVAADWQTYGQAAAQHRPDAELRSGTATWPAAPGSGGIDSDRTRCTLRDHTARVPRVLAKTQPLYGGAFKCNFLRAPSAPQQFFASEQIVDELAHAMNMDPVAFRRQNIDGSTDRPALRWLAVIDGCDAWPPAGSRRSRRRTSADGQHRSRPRLRLRHVRRRRQVGIVADVEVNMKTGKIVAKHLYIAQNNGITIGPQLVAQPDERRCDPGPLAGAVRADRVHQGADHEPRLGHVPDPPLQGQPEGDAGQRPSGRVRHGEPGLRGGRNRHRRDQGQHGRVRATAGRCPARASRRRPRSARRSRTRSSTRRVSASARRR